MTSTSGRSDTSPLQISHISKLLSSSTPAVSLPVEQSTFLQSSGPNIQQAQGHAAIQDTIEAPAVLDGV